MGTHPIFESDFDCLTEWCKMVFKIVSEERLTPLVQSYCPKTGKQDELCRQAIKTYAAKWFTINSSNAYNSIEKMYFKREHVEKCKRINMKLKTEQSFLKPETKSVTIETVSRLQPKMKISWERPKLIYSLVAPPLLLTERGDLEDRETPPKPEILIKSPFTFLMKINSLKWDVKDFEELYGPIAIYDMNEKRKVTENFNFRFGTSNRMNAVFSLDEYNDKYVIVIRIEKPLQGDQYDPIEAYQRDIPDLKREKI